MVGLEFGTPQPRPGERPAYRPSRDESDAVKRSLCAADAVGWAGALKLTRMSTMPAATSADSKPLQGAQRSLAHAPRPRSYAEAAGGQVLAQAVPRRRCGLGPRPGMR